MEKYTFIKLNADPIEIECVPDEHEAENDYLPSFWFYNRRYFLKDFIHVHNNPWIYDSFPEFIHGMETDNYYRPLFIEILNNESLNVYEEKPTN